METFDWVKARARCSLEGVFRSLKEVVDSDVKSVNQLSQQYIKFGIQELADTKFSVERTTDVRGFADVSSVVFELTFNEIVVRQTMPRPEKHLFSAKPRLNPDGDCLLDAGELELLTFWQVSRKALEDLFFPAS